MDESSEDSVLDETTEDATRLDETSDDDSVTVKSSKNTKTKLPSTKKAAVSKSTKAGLKFPVSRFQRYLRKGNYADHIGTAAAVYMSSVLEYLTAEILELSGQAAEDNKKVRITPRHVMLAIKNDAELNELLNGAQFAGSGVIPNINPVLFKNKSKKRANNSVDGDDDAEPLSSQIY